MEMTEEQFERLYRLLQQWEKQGLSIPALHRMAAAGARLKTPYLEALETELQWESHPLLRGRIRRLKLEVYAGGFGIRPGPEKVYMQRLILHSTGRGTLCFRNSMDTVLEKHPVRAAAWQTAALLEAFNRYLGRVSGSETAPDAGYWQLELTDTEGKTAARYGSFDCGDIHLWELSAILKNLVGAAEFWSLDNDPPEYLKYVDVVFEHGAGDRTYCYRGNGILLRPGDRVWVPVGSDFRKTGAIVVGIRYGSRENAPYPADKLKPVLGLMEPERSGGWKFEIVKAASDELDALDLGSWALTDEYDSASEMIAHRLEETMDREQIQALMAEVYGRMLGTDFGAERFRPAAEEIGRMLLAKRQAEAEEGYAHLCPVCKRYFFRFPFDDCPVCGWGNDEVQECEPDWDGCFNLESLNEARAAWEKNRDQ